MQEMLDWLLGVLDVFPVEVVYLLVGLGAAVENVFPPVPSDTFVVLGGVLADRGLLEAEIVLAVAWASNILLGCGVYVMGLRYGREIFETPWGRWLLRPRQLEQMARFYDRYGTITVLVSRFFPVFRVLVPAFAGISRLGFWRTAVPLAVASGVWYSVLLWAGIVASRNVPRLVEWVGRANTSLVALAVLLTLLVGTWWWRTRRGEGDDGGEGEDGDGT